MELYIRPNNVSGRLIFSYRCHCATTYRSRTNRPTGCRPMVGWLVGWIDLYKIYRANIARAPKLDSNWLVQVPANGRRAYLQTAGFPRLVSTISLDASRKRTPIPWSPAPARLPLADAQWRARDKPVVTVTSEPWECESAHRTLGMRMRASDPGNTNAYKLSCLSCLC